MIGLTAERQAYFIAAVTSAIGGSLVPVPGGVLVRDADDRVVGAVGITDSSDDDEAVASAGIEAAGFTARTA